MTKKVLYLGDTSLDTAACYLAGVMKHHGIEFDYLPSDKRVDSSLVAGDYAAVIISDYMSSSIDAADIETICNRVSDGMGLLMIGGWESFVGLGGDWHKTAIADVLPVVMADSDDRTNSYGPCLIRRETEHEILGDLPFDADAAGIGGYNLFAAKSDANVLLSSVRYKAVRKDAGFEFEKATEAPLLVVGSCGKGNTAALATDAAPHWVGGFVDWGNGRVCSQAEGANEIEVGNWYAEFFGRLVKWVAAI